MQASDDEAQSNIARTTRSEPRACQFGNAFVQELELKPSRVSIGKAQVEARRQMRMTPPVPLIRVRGHRIAIRGVAHQSKNAVMIGPPRVSKNRQKAFPQELGQLLIRIKQFTADFGFIPGPAQICVP